MKKAMLLTLVLISGHAYGFEDWVNIGQHPDGTSFYMSKRAMKKSGDIFSFWLMEDYKIPENGRHSSLRQEQIDCKSRKHLRLDVKSFQGHMGAGKEVRSQESQTKQWVSFPNGSALMFIFDNFCK